MKICHINLAGGFRGGERQTLLLIRALAARGLQQMLVLRKDSPLQAAVAEMPDIPELRIVAVKRPFIKSLFAIKAFKPDLVHAHETHGAQLALLNKVFSKIPYVITRRIDKPPKNKWFTRAVYQHAVMVVALSRAIQTAMQGLIADLRCEIIPSMYASLPVNPQQLAQLEQRYAGQFVIGHIGALVDKHKGQLVLIETIRLLGQEHSDIKVLLLGEGYDRDALQAAAADLPQIEFIGFVEDVGTWIGLFDLFVFPSREEGLGSTLLDVMQQQKPIIASDVGGIKDVIQDQANGLLVPPNQAQPLAAAIEKLYADPELCARLGQAGQATLAKYSPERISECYHGLYAGILNNKISA